jgi:hypothetical protein
MTRRFLFVLLVVGGFLLAGRELGARVTSFIEDGGPFQSRNAAALQWAEEAE